MPIDNKKIEISNFTQKILKLFPNEEYFVDDGILQINYRKWKAYKQGKKLSQKPKKENISKILELPQRKHKDLYYKFMLISSFLENYTTINLDIMSKHTWISIKNTLRFDIEYTKDLFM